MALNEISQSKNFLENSIITARRGLAASQFQGPFIISSICPNTVSDRQHSSSSVWSDIEKQKYSVFTIYFRNLMNWKNQTIKNCWSIFKGMSSFVKSRNPQQCRSHHLKVIKEFKGISKFIQMIIDRFPRLKDKMEQAEQQLSQIQLQFNLYLTEESQGSIHSIKEHNLYEEEQDIKQTAKEGLNDKTEKQQLIKTSDTYFQQQHPVNSNNNKFSIFSSRSEFKPFPNFKSKTNRSSLPCFGDEPNEPNQIKFQAKAPQWDKSIKNIESFDKFQSSQIENESLSRQNFNVLSDKFDSPKDQDKGIEKMKQFLQCHYLFQLWTSKLEKIMRDS